MQKIGLVGGLSWVSTAEYYRLINEGVREHLGGHHSANVLIESLNEHEFIHLSRCDPSEQRCQDMIVHAVEVLRQGGAEVIALCANGIHRFEPAIRKTTGVNIVHIADVTAKHVSVNKITHVGLLGVMKTMEGHFYRERLHQQGVDVMIPDVSDRTHIHEKIINELVFGIFTDETRTLFKQIIMKLQKSGAKGVILGCTEIPLLIKDVTYQAVPLFSTTAIHCQAIIEASLT